MRETIKKLEVGEISRFGGLKIGHPKNCPPPDFGFGPVSKCDYHIGVFTVLNYEFLYRT